MVWEGRSREAPPYPNSWSSPTTSARQYITASILVPAHRHRILGMSKRNVAVRIRAFHHRVVHHPNKDDAAQSLVQGLLNACRRPSADHASIPPRVRANSTGFSRAECTRGVFCPRAHLVLAPEPGHRARWTFCVRVRLDCYSLASYVMSARRREGMAMATVERSVLRIDRPEVQQGMTPQHRVRPLMPAAMREGISQPPTPSWR